MDLADLIAVTIAIWTLLLCSAWIAFVAWLRHREMCLRERRAHSPAGLPGQRQVSSPLPPEQGEMSDRDEAEAEEIARLMRRQARDRSLG